MKVKKYATITNRTDRVVDGVRLYYYEYVTDDKKQLHIVSKNASPHCMDKGTTVMIEYDNDNPENVYNVNRAEISPVTMVILVILLCIVMGAMIYAMRKYGIRMPLPLPTPLPLPLN